MVEVLRWLHPCKMRALHANSQGRLIWPLSVPPRHANAKSFNLTSARDGVRRDASRSHSKGSHPGKNYKLTRHMSQVRESRCLLGIEYDDCDSECFVTGGSHSASLAASSPLGSVCVRTLAVYRRAHDERPIPFGGQALFDVGRLSVPVSVCFGSHA